MTEQSPPAKKWVDRVVEALDRDAVEAPDGALVGFARELLARASAELVERRGPDRVADDVASLFRFVSEVPEDEIGVRVKDLPDHSQRASVETVMPDCPFIVNTLREYVHAEDFSIVHLLHPVLVLDRDREGRIVDVEDRSAEGPRTSVVRIVVEDHVTPERLQALEEAVRARLQHVRMATEDFEEMLERCREIVDRLEEEKERLPWRSGEVEEIQDLLEWLQDGAFVFLGYREYDLSDPDEREPRMISVKRGSGLGILRDESESRYYEPSPVDELPQDLQSRVLGGPLLIMSKTNSESPVHRRARMDYVGIKKVGPEGEIQGERRFLGLFTAKAYAQDPSTIPILRRKLREVLEAEGATKGTHDYNQILRIFNSMPKEELFVASVPELIGVITEVMETEGADEVRLITRTDPLARGVHVMVMLPRTRFSEKIRKMVQEILLEAYEGDLLNYHLTMNEGDQARLHFYLTSDLDEISSVNVPELEERIRESVRSWDERLADALERTYDPGEAQRLVERHAGEFTTEYKATMDVGTAVEDIGRLEALEETGLQQLALERVDEDRPEASVLKVFAPSGMYVLSDLMPTLENLGLRVVEADKYDLHSEPPRTLHTFRVESSVEWGLDRDEAAPRMAGALRAIHQRRADDDSLNSLVLSAGLHWREVAVLRAYGGYAFRIGAVASRAGVRRPLVEHPGVARLLFRVFEALHGPETGPEREREAARVVERFHDVLDQVRSIEHDRTYRRLLSLVWATVRTNFFQSRRRERDSAPLVLKFDGRQIDFLPAPVPRYEVYVHGPRTEGTHLRMDRVARGGIRWSDRSEDFRIEVLGLVKTQQVKNSVIVPAGAKGGYVVKDPPEDPAALQAAGEASYREFIRGLLDVTDNIVEGEVRHPPETVVRDEPDPYLVVAADKGTAHLSDTANELASEYDFWLGDAFASGGARGYDHKELGITARGTWECVKRHFHERGVDVQEEPVTVVGIGDMSGDVFGNGMLLSQQLRLLAAFDHRHIFLDPDPDPQESWQERRRLFEMDASSWRDYREEVISEGGGVYDRDAKQIPLSAPVREMLDVEEEEMNGEALIRSLLRADVDLLWNGGIGTYVKASDETHGEVGDPGNDDVRVDAGELRASVVGEGGNLGFTQKARVEYALRGGRINTDALDNSGGVDMSDHEVNLKILLNAARDEDLLGPGERNQLLEEVTEEVVSRVLGHNYRQSLAVSLDENRVREVPAEYRDTLVRLEREGVLERSMEDLPSTEELVERHEAGQFLTRPELAVLLAYAKTHLKDRMMDSELPEDPALERLLREYFPGRVVAEVGEELVADHRLRREIVATRLSNLFVDRMGGGSHIELVRETGRSSAEVLRAWYEAYRIGRAEPLYATLEGVGNEVPAGVQSQWFLRISHVLERATRWLLTHGHGDWSIGRTVEWYRSPVEELRGSLPKLLTAERRRELEGLQALHETDGLEEEAARELATLEFLDALLPVAELARQREADASVVGRIYFGLTEEIDFPWLQEQLDRVPGGDLWAQRAAKTLSLQLDSARTRISASVLQEVDGTGDVSGAIREYRRRHAEDLERIREVLGDIRSAEAVGLPSLMVAVHAISHQDLTRNGGP